VGGAFDAALKFREALLIGNLGNPVMFKSSLWWIVKDMNNLEVRLLEMLVTNSVMF
jgi:hypothetical protein